MAIEEKEEKKSEKDKIDVDRIADGDDEEASAAPVKKPLISKAIARILTISIAVILAIAIMITLIYMIAPKIVTSKAAKADEDVVGVRPEPLQYFGLKEIRVNSNDDDDVHFIKAEIALGYKKGELALQTELNERRIQIRDLINMTLMDKKISELGTKTEKMNLKIEIRDQINRVLNSKNKIQSVVFSEFVLM